MVKSLKDESLFSLLKDHKEEDKELQPGPFLDPYSTISKASSNSFMNSLKKALSFGTVRSNNVPIKP
jgi:hypothetical protein